MSDPIPSGASTPGKKQAGRLTREQVQEVTRRVLAGEKGVSLAKEFGVTKAYVSLLKRKQELPAKYAALKSRECKVRMTPEEEAKLEAAIGKSMPEDHGMTWHLFWSKDAVRELAKELLGKEIAMAAAKRFSRRPEPDPLAGWDVKPRPPRPADIRNLSPSAAADPEFVAYYLSPQARRMAQRSYEMALAEWEVRQAARLKARGPDKSAAHGAQASGTAEDAVLPVGPEALAEAERMWNEGMASKKWRMPDDVPSSQAATPPVPGERTGKHAGSKGPAFTLSQKKKRKKR
ncbi:MAG: hypothetical protein JWL81_2028 [Verrucomicrobiales bacterium]|nr:hypothetical protein [Verrucomicrobiales bacterium]